MQVDLLIMMSTIKDLSKSAKDKGANRHQHQPKASLSADGS
jgi:hypothetical protein